MAAATPILHHYASSPYSEKVRLAVGLKGLAWRSVEIAPAPPRPLLDALTGGYRRVPVLQVGADIFCDTNLIVPTLERLHGEPTLYPDFSGLIRALSFDFEHAVWLAAIGVRVHVAKEDPPADFLRDRKEDYLYVDMSKAAMEPLAGRNIQRIRSQLAWIVATLSDGRLYLFGNTPSALDLAYGHVLWLMRGPDAARVDALLGIETIVGWIKRVEALGHGRPTPMSPEEAIDAARAAEPLPVAHLGTAEDWLKPGMAVTVTPDDFARVPVAGTLVGADADEVVIHRRDERAGDLHVHFPRAGFEVKAA